MSKLPPDKVFGGILYWPKHPDADMHGLLRACIRTRSRFFIERAMGHYNIAFDMQRVFQIGTWAESKSHVEQLATEGHYGEILTCPLVHCYLRPEVYRVAPPHLLAVSQEVKRGA